MADTNIIVIGGPNGQLKALFSKLSTVYQKQPFFNFVIIAGNLFAEDDEEVGELLAGKINVPLRTYFTIGTSPLPARVVEKLAKNEALCDNLYYLAKRSTFKTSEGIKIVTLGGNLDWSIKGGLTPEDYLPVHSTGDAKALRGANSADILLTSQWPSSIRQGSRKVIPSIAADPQGDDNIAELCASIHPRYHLSTSNTYFEREPFFHPPTESMTVKPVTKFISVAPYGNAPKQKSLFAFRLSASPATSLPEGTTHSPFLSLNRKRKQNFDSPSYSRFAPHKRPRGLDNKNNELPKKCFFCIAVDAFEAHLVTSIGEESYLALPKGPLTTSTMHSANGVTFPSHILICPTIHAKTVAALIDPENGHNRSEESYIEMTRYRKSLQNMISTVSKGALGAVTYEISMTRNIHVHWQFLALDRKWTAMQSSNNQSLVEVAFNQVAKRFSYPTFEIRDPGIGREEGDFFRVWIWTPSTENPLEGVEQCLTMPIPDVLAFNFQFGREVLAAMLGLEDRKEWTQVKQEVEEETVDAAALREAFKEFDFTKEIGDEQP